VVAPEHVTPHVPPPPSASSVQVAVPVPVLGPGHTVQALPQLAGSDGSAQAPEQSMVGAAH
jgi:hypothetical protein